MLSDIQAHFMCIDKLQHAFAIQAKKAWLFPGVKHGKVCLLNPVKQLRFTAKARPESANAPCMREALPEWLGLVNIWLSLMGNAALCCSKRSSPGCLAGLTCDHTMRELHAEAF